MKRKVVVLLTMLFFGISCFAALAAEKPVPNLLDDEAVAQSWDPLEPVNRVTFAVNDALYKVVFDPLGKVYSFFVAEPARKAIKSLLYQATVPARVAGSVLQGNPEEAANELMYAAANVVPGVVAPLWGDEMFNFLKLENDPEDIGQAFGSWGIPHGPYFVWPVIGPLSLRDSVGAVGDLYVNPLTYVGTENEQYVTRAGLSLNEWSLPPHTYKEIIEGAVDPYSAIRDAYYSNRNKKVAE